MTNVRTQNKRKLKKCVRKVDEILSHEDNYVDYMPHSDRNGIVGYYLHFTHIYLFGKTVDKIKSCGLEISGMSYNSYKDNADFKILVTERRTGITEV